MTHHLTSKMIQKRGYCAALVLTVAKLAVIAVAATADRKSVV